MARKPRGYREKRVAKEARAEIPRVLIVCEGSKTEPNYMKALRNDLRLTTADVSVYGEECGSSPASVVDFAVEKVKSDGGYQFALCIFDRDIHPDFNSAIDRCRSLATRLSKESGGGRCTYIAVTSNPSFEYWVFLHFAFSDSPILAVGKKSCGDVMLERLREQMSGYGKGLPNLYALLKDRQQAAIANARRVNVGLGNPHTKVGVMIESLMMLRSGKQIDPSSF